MKFSHAISLNIELFSNNENPTAKEVLDAFKAKVSQLNEANILEHVEIFDTSDNE